LMRELGGGEAFINIDRDSLGRSNVADGVGDFESSY
jgi:hypothetical protein